MVPEWAPGSDPMDLDRRSYTAAHMPPEYHSIKVFMVISFPYVYAFLAKTYRGPPYTSSFCMPACSWLAVSHVLFVDKLGVLGLALP